MLPGVFTALPVWDRILIVGFIIFSIYIIACLAIMTAPERRRKIARLIGRLCDKLEDMTAAMRDDEPYDASWMKYDEWKDTRP